MYTCALLGQHAYAVVPSGPISASYIDGPAKKGSYQRAQHLLHTSTGHTNGPAQSGSRTCFMDHEMDT